MDEFYKPICTVTPEGLTVITERTHAEKLIGGVLKFKFGTAQAVAINPDWEALPHLKEHRGVNVASDRFPGDGAWKLCENELFFSPNASTALTTTTFFALSPSEGAVLPAETFWRGFEVTIDPVYFPRSDPKVESRELKRVMSEITEDSTAALAERLKMMREMYGANFLGLNVLGTKQQLMGYTETDFAEAQKYYNKSNTVLAIVGDITHEEALKKVQEYMAKVPANGPPVPPLEKPEFHMGEIRRIDNSSNKDSAHIYLNFPAPSLSEEKFYAAAVAIQLLSSFVGEEIRERHGLYTFCIQHEATDMRTPTITLHMNIENKTQAEEALKDAVALMNDPEIHGAVVENYKRGIGRQLYKIRVAQPSVEKRAIDLVNAHLIGAPLLSPGEKIAKFESVTPDEVAEVLAGLKTAPMYLHVYGHESAIGWPPKVEVIDGWRKSGAEVITLPARNEQPMAFIGGVSGNIAAASL